MTRQLVIIAPMYDEKQSAAAFVSAVDAVCLPLTDVIVRLLIIDDGSRDGTAELLDKLAEQRPHMAVLHLSRNFGHQAALSAGLDWVANQPDVDACLCMDADLQHPSALIPELLRLWQQGYEVVYTVRDDSKSEGLLKRTLSAWFYGVLNRLSEHPVPAGAADFRLLDRKALAALASLRERSRFLRGLSVWIGFRQIGLHYQAAPRHGGQSKYTWRKMIALALDGLVSTSAFPLRWVIGMGLLVSALALTYLVYVVGAYFLTDRAIVGWSSVIVSVLLLGGLQLVVLGMIGFYVAKVFDEVKARPLYVVRDAKVFSAAPPKSEP